MSQLRRGATFCRRLAAVVLVIGFAGTMAIAFAVGGAWGEGLSLPTLLAVMAGSILGILLFVALFLMVARLMEGLAEVVGREVPPAGGTAGEGAAGVPTPSTAEPGSVAAATVPGKASGHPPAPIGRWVEHIRIGQYVKLTTGDGWTGWVPEADLAPTGRARLPRTAAGVCYRPPLPSLTPGRERPEPGGGHLG